MNINSHSAIRECTSCQLCGAVCPTSAISISLNKDGFYRPIIDDSKCIDCGLCVKSCYKFDAHIHETIDLSSKILYAAYANDVKIIDSCTSGGIADLLATRLIEQGYKCIGVEYDCVNNVAKGAVATTINDIKSFRGSKYIQSFSVNAFKTLVNDCKNTKFAIFGLPCQIYAIDKLLRRLKIREQHVLIDLYCHGCPSLNVWTKYIAELKKKYLVKNVLSANFRSKVRGWGNFVLEVVVEGKTKPETIISPKLNDPFYELFFSDLVLNDSCPDCKLRSTLEYTDIRLGDFWGHCFVNNNEGMSGVTIASTLGSKIFELIKGDICFSENNFINFLPYQSYGRDYKVNEKLRTKLLSELSNRDIPLKTSVSTYHRSLDSKKRVMRFAKNIIKLLPQPIISSAKKIFFLFKR